ncbi:hypothetical protein [Arthrobacter sp. zg-Y877]|uniref:hypothetical protein n=1 Tax=Arthrobacter sp. zg-Y877 TaxID=3049074 RepID=UPI0025A49240|nr:hypothetical protein [Arthrobacter sp. zg-Y877]MDM7991237.1 hypothetical protein [Arthrobacter sp. zg-Y877]
MAILSVLFVQGHPTRNAFWSDSRDGSLSHLDGHVHQPEILSAKTVGTHAEVPDS